MKKAILMITALLALPISMSSQDGNASFWENAAGITGGANAAFGEKAGASSTGKGNVFLGFSSGLENSRGDGNIFIGNRSGYGEQGSNLLYIENSDSRYPLIWGSFAKDIVNVNGSLGVGTSSPSEKMHVYFGNILLEGDDGNSDLGIKFKDNDVGDDYKIRIDPSIEGMRFDINSKNIMTLSKYNFNVGIGTTTPDEKLAVNGKIHAKEVRVDLNGWPDFVFENGYQLPSLKEVEEHIKYNGHLKNIPSAAHVEENAIELGNMNAKLLQKIEELTLYAIQQDKALNRQKEKNKTLEDRLEKLGKLIIKQ